MEEASVAGESPDRSKQRESSAERTSGSAGPVPGSRDPRLAVAREAEPSEGRGTADTATRVLSVRDDGPSGERDDSATDGDGRRLREAVAAWVRPAEPGEDLSGDAGREPDEDERDAASSPPEADETPRNDTAADADAGQKAPTGDASGNTGADGGSGDTGADATTDDTSEDAGANDGSGDTGANATASDAPEDTGANATTDDGPEDTGANATASDAPEDTGANATTDDGPEDTGANATASNAPEDAVADATTDDAPEDTSASRDEDEPSGAVTEASAAATADEGADASRDGDADDASEATSPVHGDGADADAAASDGTGTPEGDGAASSGEDGDGADADAGPSRTGGAGSPPAAEGAEAKGGKAKGPVDQPTAVFRTGRPSSAPSVDQPTTMLKLGDAAAKAESDRTGTKDDAETGAERTSKFVALKKLDDPGVRKPPRGTDATTALRTVPPAEATTSLPQVGPERTTQQPLPPRPPLDLLAELTNTPPPPQTPLRTAVRRVKIWTPLVLLLVIVFAVVQNVRPLPAPTLELTAEDSYTFEGDEIDIPWPAKGQAALDVDGIGTFGSSGEQKPVPIASVAKVMTAYLVLRDHPLKSGAEGPKIKVDELAEKQSDAGQESTVDVTAGDEISQREAIEAILIASANNVARLLARWDAGSEKAFVEKMNDAAEDLGMTNTTYTDPSGLNNTTVSTAVDQVKLARAAMKQPAFREVAAMMEYIDYKGVKHGNWNQLVGRNDVVGIKTGTTTSALGNLSFAAKKDVDGETHRIIGAVVRQPEGGADNTILAGALSAGDQLIRAAQGALKSATILKKGTVVGYADDGLGGRTPVAVTEDVKAVGWAGLSVKLTFAADELPHTAKAGTKVGTLTVGDGTSSAVKVPVALREDLVEPGFTDRLTRIA
nr:D-alanyl-D-alanine carboxypeptidase [Streptomyces marokkonensis]